MTSLQESRNEWVSRLVNILTPFIIEGFKSIFTESYKLCMENNEEEKYLMTFQNFLARVPKWNNELIEKEVKRITENSNCTYIEDLITCVHIVQLKALTCMRVGQKQKKIDIDIPKISDFVHKIYIHVARKVYSNVYLFENKIQPLDVQKNNRELEIIVKECILNSVRESIPIENILRSYLDQTEEEIEEEVEEKMEEKVAQTTASITDIVTQDSNIKLKTNDNINISSDSLDMKLNIDTLSQPVVKKEAVVEQAVKKENDEVKKSTTEETTSFTEPSPVVVRPETPPRVSSPVASLESTPNTLGKAIKFSNYDKEITVDNKESINNVSKSIENLEAISNTNHERRKMEEEEDDDEEDSLKIMDDVDISIDALDINTLN